MSRQRLVRSTQEQDDGGKEGAMMSGKSMDESSSDAHAFLTIT